ncbi:hypothetical protein AMK19_04180 [Kitasatospora sp. CB01950]|nr:hypothetical protein AMK19_04180 [Kitasatospora sp. CB01950]
MLLSAAPAGCGQVHGADERAVASVAPVVSASARGSDLLRESRAAAAEVRSVRATFRMDRADGGELTGEASTDRAGNCVGWTREGGARMDFVRRGGTVWLTPDESLADRMDRLGGRTMKLSADNETARDLTGFCDEAWNSLASAGLSDLGAEILGSPEGGREVDGVKAVAFKSVGVTTDAEHLVAAEGRPYLLAMSATRPARVEVKFGDFDRPFQVVVPPPSEVVDGGPLFGGPKPLMKGR